MRFAFVLCLAMTLLAGPAAAELKLTNPTEIHRITTQWPLGLAASGSMLYVAYVNSKGDVRVRTYDGDGDHGGFPDPKMPSGVSASWNPALAVVNSSLYVAFRSGEYSDGDATPIYVASYDLGSGTEGSWSDFTDVSEEGVYGESDKAPALAVQGSWLWMVGKNNSKHAISQAWFGDTGWGTVPEMMTCWPSKSPHDNWGTPTEGFPKSCSDDDDNVTLYAKNQILSSNPGVPQTPQAPSLTYDGTMMRLAYRGGVYDSDSDLENMYLLSGNTSGKGWGEPEQIPDFESYLAPAIVSVGPDLGIFFSNHDDSDNLAFSAYTGSSWSAPVWAGKQPDTPSSKASAPTATPFEDAGKIAYSIIRQGGKKAYLYFADYTQ